MRSFASRAAGGLCTWLALSAVVSSCDDAKPLGSTIGPPPPAEATPVVLKRLTKAQYTRSAIDLIGDIAVPISLEPDEASDGFLVIGGSKTSISALGVDRYEAASYDIAGQAMKPGPIRDRLVPCTPTAAVDKSCAEKFVRSFGRRAFRRPLQDDEAQRYIAIAEKAANTLNDFHQGLAFALAGMLQSPSFLFRVELGEPAPDRSGLRYTSLEMATRLGYFLWNTTPDDELLDAAERGELVDRAGLERQVDRMIASPKARHGLRNFFSERLALYQLDDLVKDTKIFPQTSAELGPDAREETLRTIEDLVFDRDADFRQMMTSKRTFINRRLAALYDVQAASLDGFAPVLLPKDSERQGLLGQASVLAQYAHSTSSSSTLRGKFMRTVLLCATIPPPPADVDTSLPEPSPELPTLRDRMKNHMENPSCNSCHFFLDPIGLGLERFDGIGKYRLTEQKVAINPSGNLDRVPFDDARGLGEAIAQHRDFHRCLTRHLYRYAVGRLETDGEEDLLEWLSLALANDGFRVKPLLKHVVMSEGFRFAKEAQ
jgi:hypothetical protein